MTGRYSEDDLIATFFAPLAGAAALGLKDDAALLPPQGEPLAVTADMLVAGVHFFPDDPPSLIAKKALRVNLSDLAAKGATPCGFLLSIALPPDWSNDWLSAFARGLGEDARAFRTPLLGGDTSATPGPLTIAITAMGAAPRFVPRAGAQPGDGVYVSGTIGDAALGLLLRRDPDWGPGLGLEHRAALLDRYLLPEPRLDLVDLLRAGATAAMDVSDGLAGDLAKLTRASGVSARVEIARIPLSSAARAMIADAPELLEIALTGGDDYEILFTAGPGFTPQPAIALIGEVVAGDGAPIFEGWPEGSQKAAKLSYRHF